MKKIILVTLLFSTSVFGAGLAEQIHATSAGKLIKVSVDANYVGVTSADGKFSLVRNSESSIQVANILCNLNLTWSAANDAVYCIAK